MTDCKRNDSEVRTSDPHGVSRSASGVSNVDRGPLVQFGPDSVILGVFRTRGCLVVGRRSEQGTRFLTKRDRIRALVSTTKSPVETWERMTGTLIKRDTSSNNQR